MEILKVEHLVKQYGKDDNAVLAVNDISFSVEQGEFVAIVGSSGSGKSTLLHLLGGVDRPTSGKVYIQGEDIYSLNSDKIAIFRRRLSKGRKPKAKASLVLSAMTLKFIYENGKDLRPLVLDFRLNRGKMARIWISGFKASFEKWTS